MEIAGTKTTIKASDGYRLNGTYWKNKTAKGIVAINPGIAVGQTFYHKFAHWLAQHNFDVLTYDYRGIG